MVFISSERSPHIDVALAYAELVSQYPELCHEALELPCLRHDEQGNQDCLRTVCRVPLGEPYSCYQSMGWGTKPRTRGIDIETRAKK